MGENPIFIGDATPNTLSIQSMGKVLLEITKDGEVKADDLESASEAGRVFVESVRAEVEKLVNREV